MGDQFFDMTLPKPSAILLLLIVAAAPPLHAGEPFPYGSIRYPADPYDLRNKFMNSAKVDAFDRQNCSLDELLWELKLPHKLRCSTVLRWRVGDLRFSMKFEGGTVKQFLKQLVLVAPVTVDFSDYAVVFEPRK